MGARIERIKRFARAMGNTLKNIGVSAGKVMENIEKSDKAMNEKLKNITRK